jgi:nucleotide-binding universal stress UspA family protein
MRTARRRRRSANGEIFAGAEENEMTFLPRRILLATDGSEEAELAARVAVELVKSTGSELHLVHVKLLPLTPPYPDVLDWRWGEDLERAEREARELLHGQVKKVKDAGGTVAGAHLREEEPAEEIVALAEELGADLIVVGRRNRGRTSRALGGSVSDWVVRHAHSPVLVVPSHKGVDNRARLSRGTRTARSEASKEASAQR